MLLEGLDLTHYIFYTFLELYLEIYVVYKHVRSSVVLVGPFKLSSSLVLLSLALQDTSYSFN